jgi:hypothetical protein
LGRGGIKSKQQNKAAQTNHTQAILNDKWRSKKSIYFERPAAESLHHGRFGQLKKWLGNNDCKSRTGI